MTDKTKEFIDKAIEVHGDKYDYSKVEYKKCEQKVIINCYEHGDFEQTPKNHLQKKGCKKCGLLTQINKQRKTTEIFIKEAIKVHGNIFDYSKTEYTTNKNNITVICKSHGLFNTNPKNHLNGHGCKKCGINKVIMLKTKTNNQFILEAQLVHKNKYNYAKTNYTNCDIEICITCPIHGDFFQKPSSHLNNGGCNKCGIDVTTFKNSLLQDEFINKVIEIHGNKYDYSKVIYTNINSKLCIICPKHGEFIQTANMHKNGKNGCPNCSNRGYSNQQIQWLNFIQSKENISIQHAENSNEYQIPNTKFKADGYCKETNTIYEYHGDYWHGNPYRFNSNEINKTTKCTFGELYQNTLNKEQQIRDLGFNLITIWESDWIKLNKCVKILQRKFRISKLH
jgi:hypothetical protein